MKAERRHELQTNSLAQALQNFPQFMQQYGTKILIAIVLIVLLVVLLRYRAATVEQHEIMLSQQLSSARAATAEIRQPDTRMTAEQVMAQRQQLVGDVEAALSNVLDQAEEPRMRAEALLARGDLYWALATAPMFPTTQPAAQPQQTPEDLLKSAQAAYEQVIKEYSPETRAVVAARFGLAAIAETASDFEGAERHYKSVIEEADLPMYRELAEQRLAMLTELRRPVYLGPPATFPAFDAEEPEAPAPEAPAPQTPEAQATEVPAPQPQPAPEAPAPN